MVLNFFLTHVILTSRKTEDDIHFIIRTKTDRFAEAARAIAALRPAYPGYELFETF
jgi:hypothetical protein